MLNTLKLQCDSNSKQSTFSAPCAPSTRGSERVCTWSLILVQLFVTPWTVAHHGLLCLWDYSGKNTGVGCHFLLQGNLPDPGIKLMSLVPSALSGRFFTCSATWEALSYITWMPSKDGIPLYIATYRICNSLICCWCKGKMLPRL